jgi:plasmid replication initiation protein
MAIDPVTAALDIGGKLIDRLWPDPAQRDLAKLELLKMQQMGELAQITVNQEEAKSGSTFVAGWRPSIGWVCSLACAWNWILLMGEKTEMAVKSNRLVEASYRLTMVEQQIILFAICRSREEQKGLNPNDWLTITAKEFAEMFGSGEKVVYDQLREAMKTLYGRSLTLYDTHPDTGKPRVIETRWISATSYIDGAGAIQIIFAPLVIPYITRLEKEFTLYRLEKIGNLSSVHAVRMYELLLQYMGLGKREFEINRLKKTLGVSEEYQRIDLLKRSVIDLAVKQINAHTDITTSYTQRKTGRSAKSSAQKYVKVNAKVRKLDQIVNH